MDAEGPVSRASSLIRHLLAFTLVSMVASVVIPVALLMLPWRGARIRLGNHSARLLAPIILRIAGIRVMVDGREKLDALGPAIFVTNHASNADPWVGMWLCPVGGCGVAKREITKIPFFGQGYWLLGHLLIDRRDSASAVASMKMLAQLVSDGGLSVWIWPEGTQSRDGRLLEFKRGFAHIAVATGLPVVPVVLHDAHDRWPARSMTLIPGTLRVEILDAIDTSEWTTDSVAVHAAELQAVFRSRLGSEQQPALPQWAGQPAVEKLG